MANINNIKIGSNDLDPIMFDTYYIPLANPDLKLETIIPKDNTSVSENPDGTWEVNDGWDVEFTDNGRTIKINKFKIDTWGIRHKVSSSSDASYKYKKMQCKIKGLTYVNENIVKANVDSEEITGFANAYTGNGGWIVEWYPGLQTSGNYVKGLVIQGQVYTDGWNNARDCSYAMGRAPWEINATRDRMVTDGVRPIDMMAGGGCWAYCVGLFGGVQNATSHLDDANGAYRVYDISDNPIFIYLDVPDLSADIDPSTIECWDAYLGETQVYHKDRTRENCWAKYGMMFPENYNYIKDNLTISDSICCSWISPTKLHITKVPAEGLTITKVNTTKNVESSTQSYQALDIKVVNKPNNITAKFARTFTNVTENYDEEYSLANGATSIPAFSQKMYLTDQSVTCNFTEFGLSLSADIDTECNIVIEIISVFNEGAYKSVTLSQWDLGNPILPEVTDKITDMTKTLWNCKPTNTNFWDAIKEWFSNNNITHNILTHGLFRDSNIDEITLNLNSWYNEEEGNPQTWMWANAPFSRSSIKKITLNSINGCTFSSTNRLFSRATYLEEIVINLPSGFKNYLCGAIDLSGMFEQTAGGEFKTFPANLINYRANRSHAFDQGILCSLSNYWFDYSSIEIIPIYGDDRFADENTLIMHRDANQVFNACSNLTYIGPILDMILVHPEDGSYHILDCINLTDVRIKNLNHGSWNFDGETRGLFHGNLKNLDNDSVIYLFENLIDLTTCNPEVHEEKIDKSFRMWGTDYGSSWDTEFWTSRVAVRYFETRNRNDVTIAYTNQTFTNMRVEVSDLQETDVLKFGSIEITTNGTHYITKDNTDWEGFSLSGDTSDITNIVRVVIKNGLDYTNPIVDNAILYCPAEWEDKITSDMITAANTKGWTIYLGGNELTV